MLRDAASGRWPDSDEDASAEDESDDPNEVDMVESKDMDNAASAASLGSSASASISAKAPSKLGKVFRVSGNDDSLSLKAKMPDGRGHAISSIKVMYWLKTGGKETKANEMHLNEPDLTGLQTGDWVHFTLSGLQSRKQYIVRLAACSIGSRYSHKSEPCTFECGTRATGSKRIREDELSQ